MKAVDLIQFTYEKDSLPLGAVYLSSGLRAGGVPFRLKLFPAYPSEISIDRLVRLMHGRAPILAVGCWSDMLPFVIEALRLLKRIQPSRTLILGGIGPTEVAGELMRAFPFVDFLIRGCGVSSLPQLVRAIGKSEEAYRDIPGLLYRRADGRLGHSLSPQPVAQTLPAVADYGHLPGARRYRIFNLRSSSGCPYSCSYCFAGLINGKRVCWRPLDQVMEEIAEIVRIKAGSPFTLEIVDEAFIVDRQRVLDFCARIHRRRLRINWHCYGRVDRVDESLLRKMAAAGCRSLFFGIESGSDRVLRRIGKGFTARQAVEAVCLAASVIPHTVASFMYLFPFETPDDLAASLELEAFLRGRGVLTVWSPLAPVKGSALYDRYKKSLRFSASAPAVFHKPAALLPEGALSLVRAYPQVFYYYYHYAFERMPRLLSLARAWEKAGCIPRGGARV